MTARQRILTGLLTGLFLVSLSGCAVARVGTKATKGVVKTTAKAVL